ncbi:MAG: hypothetical protein GY821_13370 [Gammaproteobacteria bacterium]|nr:hypothetical protein [Gammaproteobacteria bacterium]
MLGKCSALKGMDDKLKAHRKENNCICVRLFLITFLIGAILIVLTFILPVPIFIFFHSMSVIFFLMGIIAAVIFLLLPAVILLYNNSMWLYPTRKIYEWGVEYSFNKGSHKEKNSTDYNYSNIVSNNNGDKVILIALCLYRYGKNIEGFSGFSYPFCYQFAQDLVNSFHHVDVFISLLVEGVDIPLEHQNGRYVGDTCTIINRLNSVRVAAGKDDLVCSSIEGAGHSEKKDEGCKDAQCDENYYSYARVTQLPYGYDAITQQKEDYTLYQSDNDYEIYSCEGIANVLQVNG